MTLTRRSGIRGFRWVSTPASAGGVPRANGAYGAGGVIGQIMGVMMLVAGLYYVIAPSDSPAPVKKAKKLRVIED